jgi:hypothetical protein
VAAKEGKIQAIFAQEFHVEERNEYIFSILPIHPAYLCL